MAQPARPTRPAVIKAMRDMDPTSHWVILRAQYPRTPNDSNAEPFRVRRARFALGGESPEGSGGHVPYLAMRRSKTSAAGRPPCSVSFGVIVLWPQRAGALNWAMARVSMAAAAETVRFEGGPDVGEPVGRSGDRGAAGVVPAAGASECGAAGGGRDQPLAGAGRGCLGREAAGRARGSRAGRGRGGVKGGSMTHPTLATLATLATLVGGSRSASLARSRKVGTRLYSLRTAPLRWFQSG